MSGFDYFGNIKNIYDKLMDDESRHIFNARLGFLINRDMEEYIETIYGLYSDGWTSPNFENFKNQHNGVEVIIYGCGNFGKKNAIQLLRWGGYKILGFCDNYKYGENFNGIHVYTVNEAVDKYPNALYIIPSRQYQDEMCKDLIDRGIDESQLVIPAHEYLHAYRSVQYFDIWQPEAEEYFVDAGCFNGDTVKDFIQWTNGNYGKVYAIEPMENMYKLITETYKNTPNIEIYNYAVWNKIEKLTFSDQGDASKYIPDGSITVKAMDLDTILAEKKVTYLKMDVEGSELNALQGAQNIIKCQKPRLAICIYHKPYDFIELAQYILELVPEYKFYIRQYASDTRETVLYAAI